MIIRIKKSILSFLSFDSTDLFDIRNLRSLTKTITSAVVFMLNFHIINRFPLNII